jgi:hypothetical protein
MINKTLTALLTCLLLFIIYIINASNSKESDNIGVIFVPLILILIVFPLLRLLLTFIEQIKNHKFSFISGLKEQPLIIKILLVILTILFIPSLLKSLIQ